ncbi:ferritin-like superfamily [Gaertneriomyces semiglobifer]|nr:ferritin-like superfamily [Gaertneriomyces semiglobifer]
MLSAITNETLNLDEDWDKPEKKAADLPEEPLLKENDKRFVLFPIQYNEIWQAYKIAESKFWAAEDIDLSDDGSNWENLPGKERAFIAHAIGLLCANDNLIGESIDSRFNDEIQAPEARCFFGFQMMQKNIHLELFTVMIDLFTKPTEQEFLFQGIQQLPGVGKKIAWVQRHITDSSEHFSVRLTAFALYLATFNSSIIGGLLHLAKPKPGATVSRHLSPLPGVVSGLARYQRDLEIYYRFCGLVARTLINKCPFSKIKEIAGEAVAAEKRIFEDLVGVSGGSLTLNGVPVDSKTVVERTQLCVNRALVELGYTEIYQVENAMPWVDLVLAAERGDDGTPQALTTANATAGSQQRNYEEEFTIDADF